MNSNQEDPKDRLINEMRDLSIAVVGATLRFNMAVAEAAGINVSDLNAVNTLLRRGALSPGELSRELGLTTGATTRLIERLEHEGLALRSRGDEDRRKVTVELDQSVLSRIGPYFREIGETSEKLNRSLSVEELSLLVDWHRKALKLTLDATENLGPGKAKT